MLFRFNRETTKKDIQVLLVGGPRFGKLGPAAALAAEACGLLPQEGQAAAVARSQERSAAG